MLVMAEDTDALRKEGKTTNCVFGEAVEYSKHDPFGRADEDTQGPARPPEVTRR